MTRKLPRLHVVSDDAVLQLPNLERLTAKIARGPDVALHVRSRALGGRGMLETATMFQRACRRKAAPVFVNDRADVAMAVAADGIHLPSSGLPTEAVRRLVGPNVWIGRSSHSAEEALGACEGGADYAFLGPIWPTSSHPTELGIGIDAVTQARSVRIVAIGGITPERIPAVMEAGAYGIAAISAVWHSRDPGATVERMLLSFES